MFDLIRETAERYACRYRENAPMCEYTTIKTGGCAELLVMPNSEAALAQILKACGLFGLRPWVIGNGSNLLVSDEGLRGVVIRLGPDFSSMTYLGGGLIRCEAGAPLSGLCAFALHSALTGLEFAYGIPGTAGGAACMNAGAYGGEMKDVLMRCEHLDREGKAGSFSGEELDFGYRSSAYSERDLVVTALTLRLREGEPEMIRERMERNLASRKEKQPLEFPSAGSVFRRPEGGYAGTLIEECGLKGTAVGGAQVSAKHAGFIVNRGGATTRNVLELIRLVRDRVYAEKGVLLEPEVKFLG